MNSIKIVGARENNLKNLSLEIPKGKLTVVTGPSGSGKSSLVFDTIAAEGRFRLYKLSLLDPRQVQLKSESQVYRKPKVDMIEHLPPVVAFEAVQTRSRDATIASFLGLDTALGGIILLDGKTRCYNCGSSVIHSHISFIEEKLFEILKISSKKDYILSAVVRLSPRVPSFSKLGFSEFIDSEKLTSDEPTRSHSPAEVEIVIDRLNSGVSAERVSASFETALELNPKFIRMRELVSDNCQLLPSILELSPFGVCSACGIEALKLDQSDFSLKVSDQQNCEPWKRQAMRSEIELFDPPQKRAIQFEEIAQMEFESLLGAFSKNDKLQGNLAAMIEQLYNIGLGHLTLARAIKTLSSGELQRLRLAKQLLFRTHGVVYALDEPFAGLHYSDSAQLISLLNNLTESGNTLIISEQRQDLIEASDNLIELGDGGGVNGGKIISQSSRKYLDQDRLNRASPRLAAPTSNDYLEIRGVTLRNLQNIDASFVLGGLTCVSGVSGSGKSSLVVGALLPTLQAKLTKDEKSGGAPTTFSLSHYEPISKVQFVSGWDGRASGTIASILGLDEKFEQFFAALPLAKALGLKPRDFCASPKRNKSNLCKACQGTGEVPQGHLSHSDLRMPCKECYGEIFSAVVRSVVVKGVNIGAALKLEISEVERLFGVVAIRVFQLLKKFSLQYLKLGQALSSLSRGELQRIKILETMLRSSRNWLYIFDEPSLGLGPQELPTLFSMFSDLLDKGHSIIAIEHNPAVLIQAHRIIDLGPGAGKNGGKVIVAGTPKEVALHRGSKTGEVLKKLYFSAAFTD